MPFSFDRGVISRTYVINNAEKQIRVLDNPYVLFFTDKRVHVRALPAALL